VEGDRHLGSPDRSPGRPGTGTGMSALLADSSGWINLSALWKICVIGLICGAGLPAIFAVGLRLLSLPTHGAGAVGEDEQRIYFGNVPGAIGAGVCFAIVLAAIGLGIYWIVSSS
jgi:hypothetical protein